jgi:hypothetical protein
MDQQTTETVRAKARLEAGSPWAPPVALVILASLTFFAGLTGTFVLDDKFAILRNPVVQGWAPLADVFRLNFWGESLDASLASFRPLTTLSFVIDQRLLGGSAVGFHVSSLLWYIGLVLAGWGFARKCIGPGAAFLAMAFFVVMPVHVENVSSLAGRADTLGLLFGLLACLALVPTLVDKKATVAWRVIVAAAAFAAAMLCKESMAVLPLVVAVFAEFRRRANTRLSFYDAHIPSLVMAAVLALYFVFRLRIQPQMLSHIEPDDVLASANVWERIGYGLELLFRYSKLVVTPVGLCSGRRFAEVFRPSHVSLAMAVGTALLGLCGYLSWRDYRQHRFPFVLAAFLSWLLITGLVFAMPESMADRFLLPPSLFLCLAIGPSLLTLWNRSVAWRAVMIVVLGTQVFLSGRQARTWHDEGTLFSQAVRACPDSVHNHFRYAEYLSEQGQTAEAVWHYGLVTSGKHAFPYAWSHPALEAERTLPADVRVHEMHRLLGFAVDESKWRIRFEAYLRSFGRQREADLVASMRP